jgi:two-component system KDP operon response regulator KdpE
MDRKPVVLVVAAPVAVRRLVGAALKPAGFVVLERPDLDAVDDAIFESRPDVLVVEDGGSLADIETLLHDRSERDAVPVILMSPNSTPSRVARTLDAGADDYIGRPFDPVELVARVAALVRRHGGSIRSGRRRVGDATVDLANRRVTHRGRVVRLARAEWAVLALLLANEGRVMFHAELLAAAFGQSYGHDPVDLRTWIARLRRKLGLAAWEEGPIRTVRGIGYAFDPAGEMPRFRASPRAGQRCDGGRSAAPVPRQV